MADAQEKIQEILRAADDDTKKVLTLVLNVEKDKLHMSHPRGIVDEIVGSIKKEIK